LTSLFDKITSKGEKYGVGHETWLTLSTAALVTVNSPESVGGLWEYAKSKGVGGAEAAAVSTSISFTEGVITDQVDHARDWLEMYFLFWCMSSLFPISYSRSVDTDLYRSQERSTLSSLFELNFPKTLNPVSAPNLSEP
jgi:hypothetical protein